MGLVCSSGSQSKSNSRQIDCQMPIMIAQNYIMIIGQVIVEDSIPDQLRFHLNQLIIMRSKLAHCVVRLQKHYSKFHSTDLEKELHNGLQIVEDALQDVSFEVHYPKVHEYLIEQVEMHRYNVKQQI